MTIYIHAGAPPLLRSISGRKNREAERRGGGVGGVEKNEKMNWRIAPDPTNNLVNPPENGCLPQDYL